MCDASYEKIVRDVPNVDYVHVTPPNISHIHASMRKVEIFRFPYLHKYAKVLYLDCDVIVEGSVEPIFNVVTNPAKLYVLPELQEITHYGFNRTDQPYTTQELEMFKKEDIRAFNAGQYAFVVSPVMNIHFEDIANEIRTCYDGKLHFYEQSFMNTHFNKLRAVDYAISPYCHMPLMFPTSPPRPIIYHFAMMNMDHNRKLACMIRQHEILENDRKSKVCNEKNEHL